MEENVADAVREIITRQLRLEEDELDDDVSVMEDLGADSLDVVEMLMTIEDLFAVTVPDDDIVNLKTVRDIIEYIEAHI